MGGQFVNAVAIGRIKNMRVHCPASAFDEFSCFIEHVFANVGDDGFAPYFANANAQARPMPLAPPVTTQTF